MSHHTIRAYRGDLADLLLFAQDWTHVDGVDHDPEANDGLGETTIAHAALDALSARWLTDGDRTWAPRTTRRRMATVRSYGRWAGVADVLTLYRPPSAPNPRPHPLPDGMADVRRMLEVCRDDAERTLLILCGYCGMRVGEAVVASVHDVDLVDRVIVVHGKGKREREVPMPDAAEPIILRALEAALERGDTQLVPMKDRAARYAVNRLGLRAGLARDVASHDLRATCATAVHDACGDIRVVQDLLGHADVQTTTVYVDASMKSKREALNNATAAPF